MWCDGKLLSSWLTMFTLYTAENHVVAPVKQWVLKGVRQAVLKMKYPNDIEVVWNAVR